MIFGMEIDNNLDFSQWSYVRKKINNKLNVMIHFPNVMPRDTIFKIYK